MGEPAITWDYGTTEYPLLDQQAWRLRAACRGMDPNIFHSERTDGASQRLARLTCASCVVRAACAEWAINDLDEYGYAGGLTLKRRRALRGGGAFRQRSTSDSRAAVARIYAENLA